MPILILIAVPLIFAGVLIAVTNVEMTRYLWVAKLLFILSITYGSAIAIFGLVRQRLRGRAGEPILVSTIWYIGGALVAGCTIPAFGIYKQMLLPMRGFPWDASLASIDHLLFLGHDPWRVTHAVFGTVAGTKFLDSLYSLWMFIMYGFPALVVAMFHNTASAANWVLVGELGAYWRDWRLGLWLCRSVLLCSTRRPECQFCGTRRPVGGSRQSSTCQRYKDQRD
jgi:hypothetical protein